jgi:type II secretory pathway component PulM
MSRMLRGRFALGVLLLAVVVPAGLWTAVKCSREREQQRLDAEYAAGLREELAGREQRAREKAAADAAENQRRLRVTSNAILASETARIAGLTPRERVELLKKCIAEADCPANTGVPDLIYAGAKSPAERQQLEAVAGELKRARSVSEPEAAR